jgi:hypothetical protein
VSWRRVAVLILVVGSIAGCTAAADEPSSDSSTVGNEPSAGASAVADETSATVATVPDPSGDPQPCRELYSTQTCLAMTDEAASRSGRTRDDVTAIDIVPFPTHDADGNVITRMGGGFYARLTFTDGTTRDVTMCAGIPIGPGCMEEPQLEARSVLAGNGGYHDVPCADPPPPEGCGNPLPALEPAAANAAVPLTIDRVSIPIDHVGAYEVRLGEASLPNGILSAASFGFTDPWPLDVSLGQGVAWIDVRSLEPDGKPFQNYYIHGWRPGVERVEAVLMFDVLWFEKGAVLGIRDVVVR